MKKSVFLFTILCSSLVFGNMNTTQVKKVDKILSSRQDIKERLNLLKNKEIYIQELEEKLNNESSSIDLNEKYESLEKKYLKKDLDDLDNKKEFLEFEKESYEILSKRIEKLEKNI